MKTLILGGAVLVLLTSCQPSGGSASPRPAAVKPPGTRTTRPTAARPPRPEPPPTTNAALQFPVVIPVIPVAGTVTSVNDPGRFVVVDFALGALPQRGQRLWVYRAGQRVGEVCATHWVAGTHVAADVRAGTLQPGDAVRDE